MESYALWFDNSFTFLKIWIKNSFYLSSRSNPLCMERDRNQFSHKKRDLYRAYLELLDEMGPKAQNHTLKELFSMAANRPAPCFYLKAEAAQRIINSITANPDVRRQIERDIEKERGAK
jgi:hypothetical protein